VDTEECLGSPHEKRVNYTETGSLARFEEPTFETEATAGELVDVFCDWLLRSKEGEYLTFRAICNYASSLVHDLGISHGYALIKNRKWENDEYIMVPFDGNEETLELLDILLQNEFIAPEHRHLSTMDMLFSDAGKEMKLQCRCGHTMGKHGGWLHHLDKYVLTETRNFGAPRNKMISAQRLAEIAETKCVASILDTYEAAQELFVDE
jgi:hypothetical protein